MKKWIIGGALVSLLAGAGYLMYQTLSGPSGVVPAIAVDLDPEHTIAVLGVEGLDVHSAQALRVLKALPPELLKALPALGDPAVGAAWLGFDPTTAEGWAQAGVDAEGGIAIVVDDRLTAAGTSPHGALVARITDAERWRTLLKTKFGVAEGMFGRRGQLEALAPQGIGGFDAFLSGAGGLADDKMFRTAFAGRTAGGIYGYLNTGGLLSRFESISEDDRAHYTGLFPAASFFVNDAQAGLRLVLGEVGREAARQLWVSSHDAPRFSAHLPAKGHLAWRMTVNWKEMQDGMTAFIPPSQPDARMGVSMGVGMGLAMVGVSVNDLAEAFSGHVVASVEAPANGGFVMDEASSLIMVGVADGEKADAILATLFEQTGGMIPVKGEAAQVAGASGWRLSMGGVKTAYAVRVGDLVYVALSEDRIVRALNEKTPLSGAAAAAMDGEVVWALTADAAVVKGLLKGQPKLVEALGEAPMVLQATLDEYGIFISGPSGGQLMVLAGVLAAVGLPGLATQSDASKTTEATMNVRRIYESSVSYYEDDHAEPSGRILPRHLPQSVPLTPDYDRCDRGLEMYPVDPKQWARPTWEVLNFAMNGAHYYRYEYVSDGRSFTARAIGDLDCDGIYSTFERMGRIDADGTVSGGVGVNILNKTE